MTTNKKIKIIFIGTSDFGVLSLEALIKDNQFEVQAIITQPDKPAGRRQKLALPPIKKIALEYKLPVMQPEEIVSAKTQINSYQPDIIIVIAYAQLIPNEILDLPKFGCLNVHASLLPQYRGASCIPAAILNSDKETGITIIKMDEKHDTGPILARKKANILDDDTAGTLHDKLAALVPELLLPIIDKWTKGEIKPIPQDENKASYVPKLKKADGKIDWRRTADYIERFIRAMTPWPGAFTYLNVDDSIQTYPGKPGQADDRKIIKILNVSNNPVIINKYEYGEQFLYNNKLAVQCGEDALVIEKLQLEGKKPMYTEEFLRGHQDFIGKMLI